MNALCILIVTFFKVQIPRAAIAVHSRSIHLSNRKFASNGWMKRKTTTATEHKSESKRWNEMNSMWRLHLNAWHIAILCKLGNKLSRYKFLNYRHKKELLQLFNWNENRVNHTHGFINIQMDSSKNDEWCLHLLPTHTLNISFFLEIKLCCSASEHQPKTSACKKICKSGQWEEMKLWMS